MWFLRTLGLLLTVAVGLAACGDDDPLSSAERAAAPFDAVLIDLFGTTDTDAYLMTAERAAAELVAECMTEAGFEFQLEPEPVLYQEPDANDLAQAREQGFGIIARYRHQIEQVDLNTQSATDPNVAYLSTLTRAEIDRFFFTLDGEEAEPGQRDLGGCNGSASVVAYADWQRFFEALPNFTAMGEERDTHPDWLAARTVWQSCMVDRGFDYAEPDAIRNDVTARMRETVNEVYPGGRVPFVEQDGRIALDPAVDELLEGLVLFEQSAAVANIECTAPLADQFAAVEREVQQAFVDRNRATIDELLDAAK